MPEVKVPELAESITEGTIAEWLKCGDSVEKGEAILELETDKVNVEVVSEEEGVLQEQLASEGDTVEVLSQLLAKVVVMLLQAKKNLQTNLNLRTMTKRLKN